MQKISKTPNKLINEKSPYLLQHVYNPVYWYPWGEEAFLKAKAENKPVFLSIGYSTCHWCHVMAHESFEDDEVAGILNTNFVSIKVDKEERPEIDSIYMSVCQSLTGQGGWPLTVFMTPDQKPFFAGTYFPKNNRHGMSGLIELLNQVKNIWNTKKDELLSAADQIVKVISRQHQLQGEQDELTLDIIEHAVQMFEKSFDAKFGGFGSAPKFPSPHNLLFLMRYYQYTKHSKALNMAEKTLEMMYRGGMFDHVGYGFSRYSTDKKWLVPHFEKMLYDNALLTIAYLEAYSITKRVLYKEVAEKVITYITREMTDEGGGFYCAQDADSEGEEGKYYAFTPEEVMQVLGEKDGKAFNQYFDITEKGNFEGKSIPNLIGNQTSNWSADELSPLLSKLQEYRKNRVHLHKDDKILTSWNALMIVALAKAYKVLGDNQYLELAKAAIKFIDHHLTDTSGMLQASYRGGKSAGPAFLDDYAYLGWAFIELYQATLDVAWLDKAVKLTDQLVNNFKDEQNGGYFLSGEDNEALIIRPKELYDGAMPSGNSVAAYNLVTLAKLTADVKWQELADKQLSFCASFSSQYPIGHSFYNLALMTQLYPSKELVCAVPDNYDINGIKNTLQSQSDVYTILRTPNNSNMLDNLAAFTKDYIAKDNDATFYLCQNNSCSAPFHGLDTLASRLEMR